MTLSVTAESNKTVTPMFWKPPGLFIGQASPARADGVRLVAKPPE
jgi:hypothetical protein